MVELNIKFVGLELKNPFIVASGPPTADAEKIIRAARLGWAGAVIKSTGRMPAKSLSPRFAKISTTEDEIVKFGIGNIESSSQHGLDYWCEEAIPKIKREAPVDFVLIGSPSIHGSTAEECGEAAKKMEEAGVDFIEVGVACGVLPEEDRISEDWIEAVVRDCKKFINVPFMLKLTASIPNIPRIARAAVKGGADAISATNSVPGIIGVNVETGLPLPTCEGKTSTCGYSGPAIRPIGLNCVAKIAKAVDIPISGIGGVDDWRSAVEYIMVGASTVQVCTAVMLHGPGIIKHMTKGLSEFMERKEYNTVEDLIGVALPHIVDYGELASAPSVKAVVDQNLCEAKGCAQCVISCGASGTGAVSIIRGKAKIDENLCGGCGLCVLVCPMNAIKIRG